MLVNEMGPNFVQRMFEETGASVAEVAICYAIVRELFDVAKHWQQLEQLDNKVSAALQSRVLFQLRRTMRRATRWFVRHRDKALDINQTIKFFKPAYESISKDLAKYMAEREMQELTEKCNELTEQGIPATVARYLTQLSTVFSVMDIAQVADAQQTPLPMVAEIYFKLGDKLDLHWFLEQITRQPVANHWQALARASYREELDWQQRGLTSVVVKSCGSVCNADDIIQNWLDQHQHLVERWRLMLSEFKTTQSHEFAKFSVAMRELMLLSQSV